MAGFVFSWITTRGENHTNRRTFVPRERHLGEPLVYNSLYGLNQIRSQSEHERLAFRIAETGIEFHDTYAVTLDHEAGIENTFINDPASP
jgi:hypothetical protein